jgi:nucleotide-binding universal stress UspA family protein
MYRRILVPLDRSTFAEGALPAALSLAERSGAELHLVSVVSTLPSFAFSGETLREGAPWFEEEQSRASKYLDDTRKKIADAGFELAIRTKVLHGNPVRSLHDWILKHSVDQVVMTTHARPRLQRLWLGSVADGLVRNAPCPILLWHPEGEGEPDLKARPGLKSILVPLDGSELAEAILPWAQAMARIFEVPLALFSVAVTPPAFAFPQTPEANQDRIRQEGLQKAEEYLAAVAERLRKDGEITVDVQARHAPDAAEAILAQKERTGSDLIALSTHGHGGVTRLVLGSVADKVIRGSGSHVLVHLEADES